MKRWAVLMMGILLAAVLAGCSNPLKTVTNTASDVIESTTETTVVLEDPSKVPSLVFYDPNDNTQVALSLSPIYVDWHYMTEEESTSAVESGDLSESADAAIMIAVGASGDASQAAADASGDAADASGDAADASGDASAVVVTESGIVLSVLDVDDDSEIYYNIDTGATPDLMEQTSWKAEDIGDESADAMEIYTKLANFGSLPMKADRVYQIVVTFSEENYDNVGYYGTLTYMLLTD